MLVRTGGWAASQWPREVRRWCLGLGAGPWQRCPNAGRSRNGLTYAKCIPTVHLQRTSDVPMVGERERFMDAGHGASGFGRDNGVRLGGRGGRARRGLAVLMTTTMVMVGVLAATAVPASAAGTGTVRTGSSLPLNVRSQPNTTSSVVGTVANGTTVTLECWVTGSTVNGLWGATTLWHKARGGYISDGFVYTGVNGPAPGEAKCTTPPPATGAAKVDAFVTKWRGKAMDYDGAYGTQCVDLFNYYSRDVVKASFAPVGSAYQLYSIYDSSKYTRLSASTTPIKGDVAVWSSALSGSGGHGHVAVVLSQVNSSTLQVFDQLPGGVARVANFGKSNLLGYLRPKTL